MENKPAIAIIQARMSSTRLPGKVLLPLAGKPVIHHIVDRAKSCVNVGKVIVATSEENSDDPLVEYCLENNIEYYRGSLNNVLSRFISILKLNNYDYCVRITGDCPLIYPPFIDAQIDALNKYSGDLTWMRSQCSVLEGQGVISSKALNYISDKSKDPDDLEHVGSKYRLNHSQEFEFVELIIPDEYYKFNYRLTVDEKIDYPTDEWIDGVDNNGNGEVEFTDSQTIDGARTISFVDIDQDGKPDIISSGTTEIGDKDSSFVLII